MRLFQNSALYPSYLARLNRLAAEAPSFDAHNGIGPRIVIALSVEHFHSHPLFFQLVAFFIERLFHAKTQESAQTLRARSQARLD